MCLLTKLNMSMNKLSGYQYKSFWKRRIESARYVKAILHSQSGFDSIFFEVRDLVFEEWSGYFTFAEFGAEFQVFDNLISDFQFFDTIITSTLNGNKNTFYYLIYLVLVFKMWSC